MRILTVATMLGLLFGFQSVSAQNRSPEVQAQGAASLKTNTAEESAALAEAARKKAEEREQVRERKIRRISRGICNGC